MWLKSEREERSGAWLEGSHWRSRVCILPVALGSDKKFRGLTSLTGWEPIHSDSQT